MNTCKTIEFYSNENDRINQPTKGIQLHKDSLFSKSVAVELANLTRIAYQDFEFYEEQDKNKVREYNKNFEVGTFIRVSQKDICDTSIKTYDLCPSINSSDKARNEYCYEILGIFYYLQYWLAVPDQTRFGFIARRKLEHGKYRVFLIFRGTREPGEWFNNSQFKQIKFLTQQWDKPVTSEEEAISFGFNKMYTGYRPGLFLRFKVLNQFLTYLDKQFRRFMNFLFRISEQESMFKVIERILKDPDQCPPESEVYLSGHSLGAALATVAALHVGKLKKFKQPPSLYAFASPRVGNPKFARAFDEHNISCYRIANSEDVVTHLPPNSGKLIGPEMTKTDKTPNSEKLLEPEMKETDKPTYSLFQRTVGAAEAYTKSPVAILTLRTQVYEHVGEPFYFTHQTGYWSSNHNMDVTYGGAVLKIKDQ
jgi:triacylglycerol lipase